MSVPLMALFTYKHIYINYNNCIDNETCLKKIAIENGYK